jgi:hypothetical protein
MKNEKLCVALGNLQPDCMNPIENDRWLLDVAVVHGLLNIHDWRHRASCFKNDRDRCRYHTPHATVNETCITPEFKAGNIDKINIEIRRRAVFMFLTDCNPTVLSVLNCNNCTRYVLNQLVSLYYCCYTSKHTDENEKALAELMRALNAYEAKVEAQQRQASAARQSRIVLEEEDESINDSLDLLSLLRSDYSIGLGRLLSGAGAATNGETVGAPLAAFAARGNKIFEMSHETSYVLLTQALAYLNGFDLNASINRQGIIMAGTHDYVNRSPSLEAMNMWEFAATQEICKMEESREVISEDEYSSIPEVDIDQFGMEDSEIQVDDLEISKSSARVRHRFLKQHPLYQTYEHRQRTRRTWPKYSAKRLPDLVDLQDGSNLSDEDRKEKRELYGQGVLIMFYPFRKIADLKEDEDNWWTAYLKKKTAIECNSAALATLNSIQNFYESFCRSGPQIDQSNHVMSTTVKMMSQMMSSIF